MRTVTEFTPPAFRDRIDDLGRELFRNQDIREKIPIVRVDFTSLAVLACLWYLSLVGFGWVLVRFLSAFYWFPAPFVYAFSLLGVAGLPALFTYHNYIYDPPQLFLFTLSLVLLARQQWPAYLVLLALTSLNKETSVLLILVYVLYYHDKLGRRFWGLLLAQLGIFVAIKLGLTAIFAASPGNVVEFHLGHNLFPPHSSLAEFTALVLIIVVIAHDWRNKPEFVRCGLAMLAPLLLLNFFFGLLEEYRDYYEVYPVILVLCAHTIASVLGLPTTLREPAASPRVRSQQG